MLSPRSPRHTRLADAYQSCLAAGRVVPWNKAHEGRKLPALRKAAPLPMAATMEVLSRDRSPGLSAGDGSLDRRWRAVFHNSCPHCIATRCGELRSN